MNAPGILHPPVCNAFDIVDFKIERSVQLLKYVTVCLNCHKRFLNTDESLQTQVLVANLRNSFMSAFLHWKSKSHQVKLSYLQ